MTQKQNEQALNERMAKLLGWINIVDEGPVLGGWWGIQKSIDNTMQPIPDFTTDHNAFHHHIIPHLKERGLMEKWAERVVELQTSKMFKIHARQCGNIVKGAVIMTEAPAATLTLAAAEVCEEDNEAQPVVGDKRDLLKAIEKQNERNER